MRRVLQGRLIVTLCLLALQQAQPALARSRYACSRGKAVRMEAPTSQRRVLAAEGEKKRRGAIVLLFKLLACCHNDRWDNLESEFKLVL